MSKEYLLYDKTVKLSFSEGGHRYRISFQLEGEEWSKERPTTGVTTIQNVMNKPALVPWAARLAAEEMATLVKAVKDEKLTAGMLDELAKDAKNAPSKNRDKAGDVGTLIHGYIEEYHQKIKEAEDDEVVVEFSEDDPEEVIKAVNAYIDHWESLDSKILMIEQPVYSKNFDYAGTLDYLRETPSGKKVLGDHKTTKKSKWAPDGVYIENFAQLGGYAQALNEMFNFLPDVLEVTNVGKDGEIRVVTNEDFGMTVDDALHYWNMTYSLWYTHKEWEHKFKRS